MKLIVCILLLSTAAAAILYSAEPPQPAAAVQLTNAWPIALAPTNSVFKQVNADVYELGSVRLDKRQRSITFPSVVNMADGAVEYALVHTTGKIHESVLKTNADPLHVHLAKLLLSPSAPAGSSRDPLAARELVGEPITVEVRWSFAGATKRVRLEQLIRNTLTQAEMARGNWVYGGSRVVDGTFLAQRDGSVIAIIADPDALVNNPRPGRHDDEIWKVNSAIVPAVGTEVEVILQLEEQDENNN